MFNLFNKKKEVLQLAVEYRAPHWMVLIRNPGQKNWEPVRSSTRKVSIQDEFGAIVKTYPAIESFRTQEDAETWVRENVTVHERKSRKKSEYRMWVDDELPKLLTPEFTYQYTKA